MKLNLAFLYLFIFLLILMLATNMYPIQLKEQFLYNSDRQITYYDYHENILIIEENPKIFRCINTSDNETLWNKIFYKEKIDGLSLSNTGKYIIIISYVDGLEVYCYIYTIKGELIDRILFNSDLGYLFSLDDKFLVVYQKTINTEVDYKGESNTNIKSIMYTFNLNNHSRKSTFYYNDNISDVFIKNDRSMYIANELYQIDLISKDGVILKKNLFDIKKKQIKQNELIERSYCNFYYLDSESFALVENSDFNEVMLIKTRNDSLKWKKSIRIKLEKPNIDDIIMQIVPELEPIVLNKSLEYKFHVSMNIPDKQGSFGDPKPQLNFLFGENKKWEKSDYYIIKDNYILIRKNDMHTVVGYKYK